MKLLHRILLYSVLFSAFRPIYSSWTSIFHRKLTERDLRMAQNNMVVFTKLDVPFFTQLLFSWNALRPREGFFSFYVQVRNSNTQKWSTWHQMVDWGNSVQRSYQTKGDSFSRYVHVRLEMKRQLGDAFRIKVSAREKASLELLKAFAVTISNRKIFKPEQYNKKIAQLSSTVVKNVPRISQFALKHPDNGRICSPTSCTMLTRYLTGLVIDPIDFAQNSFDKGLGAYGSWPFNMAHAYEHSGGKNWFFNTRLNSFTDLHRQLRRNLPVVVSVRGSLKGAPREYPQGHLLLVVGWDANRKEVICHDPASATHYQTLKRYAFKDFIKAWELSHRLVYWVEPV